MVAEHRLQAHTYAQRGLSFEFRYFESVMRKNTLALTSVSRPLVYICSKVCLDNVTIALSVLVVG